MNEADELYNYTVFDIFTAVISIQASNLPEHAVRIM